MCVFGNPAMAAPPPPPPPPGAPPEVVSPEVQKARGDAKSRAAAAAGSSATDVTKGALTNPASTAAKTATGQ